MPREATPDEERMLLRRMARYEPVLPINRCKCGRLVPAEGDKCIKCGNVAA